MPLDFSGLAAAIAQLETVKDAVIAAFKTPVTNPADQAALDSAAVSIKTSTDAITAAIPPSA
jgi:hypothetical protein